MALQLLPTFTLKSFAVMITSWSEILWIIMCWSYKCNNFFPYVSLRQNIGLDDCHLGKPGTKSGRYQIASCNCFCRFLSKNHREFLQQLDVFSCWYYKQSSCPHHLVTTLLYFYFSIFNIDDANVSLNNRGLTFHIRILCCWAWILFLSAVVANGRPEGVRGLCPLDIAYVFQKENEEKEDKEE